MPGTSARRHLRQPSPTSRGASKHARQTRIERPKSALTHAIIVKGGGRAISRIPQAPELATNATIIEVINHSLKSTEHLQIESRNTSFSRLRTGRPKLREFVERP